MKCPLWIILPVLSARNPTFIPTFEMQIRVWSDDQMDYSRAITHQINCVQREPNRIRHRILEIP